MKKFLDYISVALALIVLGLFTAAIIHLIWVEFSNISLTLLIVLAVILFGRGMRILLGGAE